MAESYLVPIGRLLSHGDTLMILGALKRVPFDVRKAFDPAASSRLSRRCSS